MSEENQIEVMNNFNEQLQKNRFWGTIIQTWQDGRIELIEKKETYKIKDFPTILIQIQRNI